MTPHPAVDHRGVMSSWEAPTNTPPNRLDGGSQPAVSSSQHQLAQALHAWIISGVSQSARGAFCAWRDGASGCLAFEYPEITGYALTYLASRLNLAESECQVGTRAAEWLATRLAQSDLSARPSSNGSPIYTFDLAMIASGLLTFGRRIKQDRYVDAGLALVRYLGRQITLHGHLPPLIQDPLHPTCQPLSWSTAGQAHLLKAVQCLLLAAVLGEPGMQAAAETLVQNNLRQQASDGHFCTNPQEDIVMLHPHFYALEGLWIWTNATGDADVLAGLHRGLAWAWAQQLPTGGFPRAVSLECSSATPIEQSDVTCQAMRLALLIDGRPSRVSQALRRLEQLVWCDAPGCAIIYQAGVTPTHLNVWSTLFAAQVLDLAAMSQPHLAWQALV